MMHLVLLTSACRTLFIEAHLHFFQYFWCVTHDQFDRSNCLFQQFDGLFVILTIDRLEMKMAKNVCVIKVLG